MIAGQLRGLAPITVRRQRPPTQLPKEAGSGSVWVLALLLVLAVVAAALTAGGVAIAQRTGAVAAADLAALAGADVLQHRGSADQACASARRVAALNAARVEACDVHGEVLAVTVTPTRAGVRGLHISASARAGPIGSR